MPAPRPRTSRVRGGGGGAAPAHSPKEVLDEDGRPYIIGTASSAPWCPSTATAFKLLLTVRLSAAVWTAISDCDETFNYWEPLHYFLYGKGFQTWEYSPEFALRSYLYILVHTLPAWIYENLLHPHPMYVFFFLRCLLAIVCTASEVYFFNGILQEIGANVARLTLAFLFFSSGMFLAGTALLPSTTSMYLTMLSYGAWFRKNHKLAIFFTALSTFLSWPFVAVLGVPIAFDVLMHKRWRFFLRWCIISTAVSLLPQIAIDSQYYGKTVVAPLNIILYNIFTSHGPDLYGTESWTFYFLNGFLNFNIVFFLALFVWPLQLLLRAVLPLRHLKEDIPKWLIHLGMYLWFAIFVAQPHKEERFLFPIYPLIALAAAYTVDSSQKLVFHFFLTQKTQHYLKYTNWISVTCLTTFSLLCASRTLSMYINYSAPMNTWIHISNLPYSSPDIEVEDVYNVCIGKEWYRFSSSFFLPPNWEMKYLRSEFRGQLPQPYLQGENATREVRTSFNGNNMEEENRYEIPLEKCHYLVDLDTGRETKLEPQYSKNTDMWDIEESFPFLIAEESHKMFRAFYIPFVSQKYSKYANYVLLKSKHPSVKKKQRQKS